MNKIYENNWKVQRYYTGQSHPIGIVEDIPRIEGLVCMDVVCESVAFFISKAPEMYKLLKESIENCESTDDYSSCTLSKILILVNEIEEKLNEKV